MSGAKGGVPGPPADKGRDNNGGGNGNGNGNDNGNGNGNGKNPETPTNTSPSAPGLKKVEIEGLISAKTGDSITVNAQQVVVPATCPIRHGQTQFAFSDLQRGDRVHVRADRMSVEGAAVVTTTLRATEVILQNPGDGEGSGDDTPTTLVSVTATDDIASETPVDAGTFTLTRAGSAASLALPLTVNYTVIGTATSPDDYSALSGTVTFLAGEATTTVVVTPLADATIEDTESVILTLTSSTSYDLGSPASATVTIAADPVPVVLAPAVSVPVVTVVAFDASASELILDPGRFRFSRSGSTASSLTVTFTLAGTATNGLDYQAVPLSVTFAAGLATAEVWVRPLKDSDTAEVSETVILTLTDGAAYDVGTPASATVKISP